jgi:hypothetical protein
MQALEERGLLASRGRYKSFYIHLLKQHKKEQIHLRDRREDQIGALSLAAMWPPAPGTSPDIRDPVSDGLERHQPCLGPASRAKKEWEGGRGREDAG